MTDEEQQNIQRGCLGCIGIIVVGALMVAVIGNWNQKDDDPFDASSRAAVRAIKQVQIREVALSTFRTGPIGGGVGVLSSADAAYFWDGERLYGANGFALTHAPGIPRAPARVGFAEIEAAVRPKIYR